MKKIISLTLALLLSVSLAVPALAAEFSDVQRDHWAYTAIQDAAEKNITSGYADGTFRPGQNVTRAQFAVMLSRAFFAEDVEALMGKAGGNGWFWPNLRALADKGLLKGTSLEKEASWSGNGSKDISRYEMAQLMANIMAGEAVTVTKEQKTEAQGSIADWKNVPSQYRDAIASVYALGLITGRSDGTFGGDAYMNRAQGCVVIRRLADCLEKAASAAPAPETAPDPAPEEAPDPAPAPNPAPPAEPAPEPSQNPDPAPAPSEEPSPSPEPEPAAPTLADGSEMTEANVRSLIEGLKSQYPEGMRWTNDNSHFSSALRITGYGCAGFAFLCSDTAFGSLPATGTHSDFDRLRAGDIIRMNNDTHSVVVLEKSGNSVTVTEGNFNSSIHWGRTVSRSELESGNFTVTTRWPA